MQLVEDIKRQRRDKREPRGHISRLFIKIHNIKAHVVMTDHGEGLFKGKC
jgi:hypothetical protein